MDGASSSHAKIQKMLQVGCSEAPNLPLEDLRNITNNFSEERLIGEGGFGKVYKGVLQNGEMVAVKKLTSSMSGIHDRHFENEANHLTRLKHPNIVELVGYCSETKITLAQYNGKYVWAEKAERLLCLEYMSKGSLREYLSDESFGLDWDTRYKIIEGICYGLHYLHEEWKVNTPIIHMDLKPANILLDKNMVPKIADFGLSRLFGEEQTRSCTTSRDGTLGYMAPEYISRGTITKMSDIFSLGVIIIEIMTGNKDYPDEIGASSQDFIEHSQEFIELVHGNWRNRLENEHGHTSLEIDCQQIIRCIHIGLVCVKLDRAGRPTTSQIIKMLRGSECSYWRYTREADLFKTRLWAEASNGHTWSLGNERESRKRHLELNLDCWDEEDQQMAERPAKKHICWLHEAAQKQRTGSRRIRVLFTAVFCLVLLQRSRKRRLEKNQNFWDDETDQRTTKRLGKKHLHRLDKVTRRQKTGSRRIWALFTVLLWLVMRCNQINQDCFLGGNRTEHIWMIEWLEATRRAYKDRCCSNEWHCEGEEEGHPCIAAAGLAGSHHAAGRSIFECAGCGLASYMTTAACGPHHAARHERFVQAETVTFFDPFV